MSKKGRLKIDHLSLKGKNAKKFINKVITITPEFNEKYYELKQMIDNNEECQSLNKIEQCITNFVNGKSAKQQLISFQQLVRLKWNNDIPSIIGCKVFQLCLLLCSNSLNRDFIKILCRLLDKLYDSQSIIINDDILSQSLISLFNSMIIKPKLYYIETLTKLLSSSFLNGNNNNMDIIIWRILKLLQTMLHQLLLNNDTKNNDNNDEKKIEMNIDENDKSIDFRLPQNKEQRISLLGRDIVAAFWLYLTNNGDLITKSFQSAINDNSNDNLLIITNLFKTCNKLMTISSFHKDAITKIAFLQHLMITFVYTQTNLQINCFKCIANNIKYSLQNETNVEQKITEIDDNNDLILMNIETVIISDWDKVYLLSKMGFIRAIITQSDIEILKFELIEICYNIIINNWCDENNPNMRLYAFDTICGWITTNYNILKELELNESNIDYLNNLNKKFENIFKIIESNWEHPSRAISFMIESMYSRYIQLMDKYKQIINNDNNNDQYWMKHVENAMNLSIEEKGKYLRLKVLIKRVGSLKLFKKYPNWIMMLLEASSIVGGNAMSLIHESLNLAKQELKKKNKCLVITEWRQLWIDPICKGFTHKNEIIQRNTNSDLLKFILRSDSGSYFPLIQYILKLNKSKQLIWKTTTLRALIGILKYGKRNGIITNKMLEQWLNDDDQDNDDAEDDAKHDDENIIDKDLIFKCILHNDWEIRIETLEIICSSKLSTDIPGINQLEILKLILPYWMKLQISKHRDQFVQLIQKLLLRMKDGCYKILHETDKRMQKIRNNDKTNKNDNDGMINNDFDESEISQISSTSFFFQWNDILKENNDSSQKIFNEIDNFDQDKIINCLDWIEWFRQFLLNNLYPSCPVERMSTAITLYYFLLQIWSKNNKKRINENDKSDYKILEIPLLTNNKYLVNVLLNCMMNGWDQIRLLSYKILQLLPSPLPGFESKSSVINNLLKKSLSLTSSPRLLESDCGALLLSILFDKYIKKLNWSFDIHIITFNDNININKIVKIHNNTEEAILSFLNSFNQILTKHISIISVIPFHERYRSPHHRVHGLLTFFREILPKLNLKSNWKTQYKLHQEWKKVVESIMKNIFEIGEISLILHTRDPTEKDIENVIINNDNDKNDDVKLIGIDCRGHAQFSDNLKDYSDQQMEQMIVVSSWLGVKESCLCLAKFIQTCPLPKPSKTNVVLLTIENIEKMGNFFLKTLKTTRHNGVMEKSHAGFTILCTHLLGSGTHILINIVNKWLNELLNIVKNEAVQHWIRRSAGFPFTFLSILEAEIKVITNDRKLFEYTMNQLLIYAKNDEIWQSKVVALNVIMFIFKNATFNLCVIPFISETFKIVLPGFSHKQWAVRNSSMLCLSAIISRAIRKSDHVMKIKNIKKLQKERQEQEEEDIDLKEYIDTNNEENEFFENGLLISIKKLNDDDNNNIINNERDKTLNGTTAQIFFHQHPELYTFLLKHLDEATKDNSCLHPSLFPVLLLLSKLTPRDINNNCDNDNDNNNNNDKSMDVFKSYIMKCTSHKYQRIRIMSSRSLISIISKHNLIVILCKLLNELPNNIKMINAMNKLHGLLLQIQNILTCCYKYMSLDSIWIIDKILPILIKKLWILNSINISSVIQQSLIIICISTLHHVLIIQYNDNIKLSIKQTEIIMLYLMKLYKCCLTVLANNSKTKNDIHSTRQSIINIVDDYDDDNHSHDQSESDPEFYRKIKYELEQGVIDKKVIDNKKEIKLLNFDIGQRRLRSFASKMLLETLLLSRKCAMNKLQLTQLICILLKDGDELVVQSTANCLSSIINHKNQELDNINWSQILQICINLMKWSTFLGRRLSSIIQLFNKILIKYNDQYINKQISIKSLWTILYQIALNNSHFIVQIIAMQSLGIIVNILFNNNDDDEIIKLILKDWILILNKFSNEDIAEELRSVCVSSIQISNILKISNNNHKYKNEIIDLWIIIINLLQDFEMPIRNIASKSISNSFIDKQSITFLPNYSIKIVFNHLENNYLCQYLINKLLNLIINPNIWYNTSSKWFKKDLNSFKLFLPERPNDSFETLFTMQFATNILIKYVKNNKNFNIINLINIKIINDILSHLQQITNNQTQNKDNNHNVFDAQNHLIWSIWMIHWFSLFYCYQIISSSDNNNHQRYKLCTFIINKLKSELEIAHTFYDSITTNFCDKMLKYLENGNDYQSLSFLC